MKNNIFLFLVVLLSLSLGLLLGTRGEQLNLPGFAPQKERAKLNRFMDYLSEKYVDQIDTDSIVNVVIEDILQQLDPHSVYIPQEASQEIAESMQGNFVGIGVSFFMVGDTVSVVRVLEGGPSKAVGIAPGDRILMANGDSLFNQNLSSTAIVSKLKGLPNTPLELAIYRKQNDSVFWVNLKRGAVPLKSVDASYMIDQNVGYIKINRFSQTTFVEFDRALRLLQLTGLQSLVIDLRDNPGGYLLPATQIADTFLSAGTPIVITQSNKGQRQETQATDQGNFEKGGLYILVNEQSASASEILAGAVQDNDRGWVVGRRTFGKGLVQQQMPLGDGDAVRLTTARYYTPTGRSIQRPYDNDHEAYYAEVTERYERGEMEDQTKIPQNDSLAYTTPKGRTVYGGGGIHPDLFVPNNNTQEEEWDSFVLRSNVINLFVFVTLDANRGEYAFGSASEFLATPLTTPEVWLDKFQAYCTQNSIPFAFKDQDKILTAIKAYIGLQVYGEGVFTQILNTDDPFLRKVMDHLVFQLD